MKPDLERLRRFSLTMGLLVFTYAAAGISLADDQTVAPFGIHFTIDRPELLPIGLAVGSLYSAFRFWYFGVALSASPFTQRWTPSPGQLINGAKWNLLRYIPVKMRGAEDDKEEAAQSFARV